jgi:hypothetical protein
MDLVPFCKNYETNKNSEKKKKENKKKWRQAAGAVLAQPRRWPNARQADPERVLLPLSPLIDM